MKFLLISTSVVPVGAGYYGGIELMLETLAIGLMRAGHKVQVAAPIGSSLPKPIWVIPTVKLPDEQDRDDIALARLADYPNKDYDIILDFSHGHMLGRTPSNINLFPLLAMVWDNITVKYPKSLFNIGCVSDWQRDRFEKLYNQPAKTVPRWGYVDGSVYKPLDHPRRERYLFLGKLTPDKGAEQAIALCNDLGVGLDVVGGLLATDSRAYADKLRAMADGDKVRFYFNVDELHKVQLIQNAKAILYPVQFDEAHNLVAIEAAACQTPFIQYRRGAIGAQPELCKKLGTTVVDTPEQFKEAMKTVDDWFEPTKEDWTVKGRIPTYISFLEKIVGGERW